MQYMWEFRCFVSHLFRILYFVRGALGVLLALLLAIAWILKATEGLALGEALYLTAVTGLTIGYGDVAPTTMLGRIACVAAGLLGVIFVGLVVAVATRALKKAVEDTSRTG